MSEQVELFDIVEPNFHWLAGGNVMTASRFDSSACENDAAMEKPPLITEKVPHTVSDQRSHGARERSAGVVRPRACCALLSAPEHIYGEPQISLELNDSTPSALSRVLVQEMDLLERPTRRILFDCVDTPTLSERYAGSKCRFCHGKPNSILHTVFGP